MKPSLLFPTLGLAAIASLASPEFIETNFDMMHSLASRGVSFLPTGDHGVVPSHLLMGMGAYSPPTPSEVTCSVTDTKTSDGKVTVLIAISKCLSKGSVETIKKWATQVQDNQKTYFKVGTGANSIEFQVAGVPGTCQALTEAEANGQSLLSDDEWNASLSELGRVLDALPTSEHSEYDETKANAPKTVEKGQVPVAVLSFVDTYSSYQTVKQYELTEKISRTFSFRICEKGVNCNGNFENCITLEDPVELFMYSPFKITSTLNCANLKNGNPVVYVDQDNKRQCTCTCPVGRTPSSDNKKCEKIPDDDCECVWAKAKSGYKYEVKTPISVCEITNLATAGELPPPVPIDNYVAKGRSNNYDSDSTKLVTGPHIFVGSGPYGVPPPYPQTWTYTWSDYQSARKNKIDLLKYTAYGKYAIEVDAFDYNTTKADCKGCLAIVDKFRPQATTTCPKIKCDKSTSDCTKDEGIVELTNDNLADLNTQITAFYDYQSKASNDACSTSKRCDFESAKSKNFFDDSYSTADYKTSGPNLYNEASIKSDLNNKVGKLKDSDLCKETPVAYGECTRCVDLSVTLKEKWTDFECGCDDGSEKCEGKAGQTCGLKQCVVAFGDTIAVASAKIVDSVKDESDKVVKELVQQGYNTETQVHVALECTEFVDNAKTTPSDKCKYTAKVQDLVEVDIKKNDKSIFSDDEAEALVSWRYRVDNGDWKAWDKKEAFDYKKAETQITIEAWTKCGIVRKFFFYVNLHLNNPIKVCDHFRSMWYQTTSKKLTAPDDLCMYPKSDFAELTFDYHANIGLQFSPDRLSMTISKVECRLTYDDCKGSGAKIVDVSGDAREIVTRFAILARRTPTSALTKFHVTCDFTYKGYGGQQPEPQTCNQDFFITDCSGPEIDKPCPLNDKSCAADSCANSPLPAPYEACGGNIVSIDSNDNAVFTSASNTDSECCDFCPGSYKTTCTRLSALPSGANDIRRCEPALKPASLLAKSATLSSVAQATPSGTSLLLSASAVVALAALVAVQRRRAVREAETVENDAYYPLLH